MFPYHFHRDIRKDCVTSLHDFYTVFNRRFNKFNKFTNCRVVTCLKIHLYYFPIMHYNNNVNNK